jgi:transcriptional regulator with XRE-family HTH domain
MNIAETVRAQRDRAALTQAELARRAGVSQATVSAVERGSRLPSHAMTATLLGALGMQVRMRAEPLETPVADLDAAIDAALAIPVADRLTGRWFDGAAVLRYLEPLQVVVEGAAAAILHGAPLSTSFVEVALERGRTDALADMIKRDWVERWSDTWLNWGAQGADPRLPGPARWRTEDGEFRVRFVESRPEAVTILLGDVPVSVRALHEVESEDPQVRRALARLRGRDD